MNDSRYDEDDEDDEDDDDDSVDDEDAYSDENTDKKSISDSDYSDDDWQMIGDTNNGYADSDDEKYRKSTYKLPLDMIEFSPYLAINNQKILKWKFLRRDESDWTIDTCSFKVYSSVSKNFSSAFYLLDELIDQLSIKKFQQLNDIWLYLIKVSCAQVFSKRLKIFSLLVKLMQKVDAQNLDRNCINIFALKPLKNLQITLECPNKDDRNLSRALYELFFFSEKLAIKWCIQHEYKARMKDKNEIIEKLCETAYFINVILVSLNMSNNMSMFKQSSLPKRVKPKEKPKTKRTAPPKKQKYIAKDDDDVSSCEDDDTTRCDEDEEIDSDEDNDDDIPNLTDEMGSDSANSED